MAENRYTFSSILLVDTFGLGNLQLDSDLHVAEGIRKLVLTQRC